MSNTEQMDPLETPVVAGDDEQEEKDPYKDLEDISERIDKCLKADSFSRVFFENAWARNIFFYAGAQWLRKDGGRWTRRNLPAWFPRAQTNKLAEKANDLITQLLQGGRVPISYTPATDDEADIGTADVGERLREVIYTEAKCDEQAHPVASWLILTGNAFGIPHYDMDEAHGTTSVPYQQCTDCGAQVDPEEIGEAEAPVCPTCGSPNLQPTTDIAHEYPIGAIQMEVAGPFEIRGDHRITDVRKWCKFVHQKKYDLDYAKERWPEFKEAIQPDSGNSTDTAQYFMGLFANLTPDFAFGAGLTANGSTATKYPKVTAYCYRELPTEKYPEGIYAVRLGPNKEAIVEAGPLPTEYGAGVKKGKKFLPLIHWRAHLVPGRLWGKTSIDDLITLQVFRNMLEAVLRLTAQRTGNPMWLLPRGCAVDVLTGEPGQTVSYNPQSVGGTNFAKPERVPADLSNVGPLIMLISKIDDAMERISGTFFLQGGDAPPGVTAASALAYLGEKGQQSLSTLRTGWAQGWAEFDKMALEIARSNWDDNRMRAVSGKNRKWQVEQFSKADIQGAVNMIVDWNALAPKSNATERATIGQLVQLGMVNPQDPETQIAVLKKFGMLDLKGSFDIDIQDAAKEEDRFTQGVMPQVRPFVDNSQAHLISHIDFAKTDEFRELPDEQQKAWLGHIQNTVLDITTRRLMLTQAGLDPDVPALAEVPSAAAATAAQASLQAQQLAAQQNGGVPNGAEGPDPRLNPDGTPSAPPANDQMPDIADSGVQGPQQAAPPGMPDNVKPEGSPRRIDLPSGQ
jgi:DNA-directed RNA polymerase subunit RPC12/RpoP